MKKIKPIYKSDCCNTTFDTKSNGLYSYYVCHNCHNKTNPKKLDMRKKENKPVKKKGSGKMLSRALNNSTPSKNIKEKLSLIEPPRRIGGKLIKGKTKKELDKMESDYLKNKKPRAKLLKDNGFIPNNVIPVSLEDACKYAKKIQPLGDFIKKVKEKKTWWDYLKAKKIKDGEYIIKVLGENVTILPNITILRIGHESKKLSGNNNFLLLEKKVQEFMVTLTKELLNNNDKGQKRYFMADEKGFEFAFAKYPKVPKVYWFFAFVTLISENVIELNEKRIKNILNKFYK